MRHSSALLVRSVAVACATLAVVVTSGQAQVAYDSPNGRVEILGLRHWTLTMLQDSIRRYAPGHELYDAACMVTLRDSLHFVEASVEHFEMALPGGPRRSFLTIKVVEPDQAGRVQWDARERNEFSSLLPDYAPLIAPVTDSTGTVLRGRILYWLQFSNSARRRQTISRAPAAAHADADRLFSFLDHHAVESDRTRAMRVLAHDGFWVNRMTAVAVLSNFGMRDSTWLILVRALRDPHETVRNAAAAVLGALPARTIDWRASTGDLRLLLGGTNLPAIQTVFDLLARTNVDPSLASQLLRDNADWVLDHLGSETPMASDGAHRLLVRLNGGNDLGRARAPWAAWIRTL
jgi:hypothetical protein